MISLQENLLVRQANPEDYEKIREMLIGTAEWLKEKGSTQWKGLLNGKDVHDTPKAIERGEVYLAEIDKKPAGMFVLWDEQSEWDKGLWGKDSSKDHYYLHRITVARSFHGMGLGIDLVKAAIEIARKENKKQLRLDCIATNNFLNQFYPSCGFTFIKTVYNHPGADEASDFNLYKISL